MAAPLITASFPTLVSGCSAVSYHSCVCISHSYIATNNISFPILVDRQLCCSAVTTVTFTCIVFRFLLFPRDYNGISFPMLVCQQFCFAVLPELGSYSSAVIVLKMQLKVKYFYSVPLHSQCSTIYVHSQLNI